MNRRTHNGVIAMEIEYLGVAWCNAPRRLLTNPTYYSGPQRQGTTNGKGFLGEAVEINIIDRGDPMSTWR